MEYTEQSRIASVLTRSWERVRPAAERARVTVVGRRAITSITDAYAASRLSQAASKVESTARASWLYRWLTAEPEPDVVVIDLRETWTVGPILAWVDRSIRILAPQWAHAESRTVVEHLATALAERPVRTASQIALVAIVVVLAGLLALGSPDQSTLGLGLIGLSLALAGTRVEMTWQDITASRTYDLLVTLLEPPEPPEKRK